MPLQYGRRIGSDQKRQIEQQKPPRPLQKLSPLQAQQEDAIHQDAAANDLCALPKEITAAPRESLPTPCDRDKRFQSDRARWALPEKPTQHRCRPLFLI